MNKRSLLLAVIAVMCAPAGAATPASLNVEIQQWAAKMYADLGGTRTNEKYLWLAEVKVHLRTLVANGYIFDYLVLPAATTDSVAALDIAIKKKKGDEFIFIPVRIKA